MLFQKTHTLQELTSWHHIQTNELQKHLCFHVLGKACHWKTYLFSVNTYASWSMFATYGMESNKQETKQTNANRLYLELMV